MDVAVGLSLGVADLFSGVVLNNVVGGDKMTGSSIGGAGFSLLGGLIDNAAKCVGKSVPFLSILSKIGGAIQLLIDLYECLNKEWCLRIGRPISQDPNEKVGPRGFGLMHLFRSEGRCIIREFENLSRPTPGAENL